MTRPSEQVEADLRDNPVRSGGLRVFVWLDLLIEAADTIRTLREQLERVQAEDEPEQKLLAEQPDSPSGEGWPKEIWVCQVCGELSDGQFECKGGSDAAATFHSKFPAIPVQVLPASEYDRLRERGQRTQAGHPRSEEGQPE